jgi:hypothetical protein
MAAMTVTHRRRGSVTKVGTGTGEVRRVAGIVIGMATGVGIAIVIAAVTGAN